MSRPVLGLALACAVVVGHADADSILIQHATIHTQTDQGIVENADLLIRAGRIVSISIERLAPSAADTVVDARGQTITPGLFSAHSQLGLDEIDLEATTVDSRLDPDSPGPGPAFDVQYGFNAESVVVEVNLAEGVTHGVIAPRVGSDIIAGLGAFADFGRGQVVTPGIALFADVGASAAARVGGSRAAAIGQLRYTLKQLKTFRPRGYQPNTGEYSRRDMLALKAHLTARRPLVISAHRANEITQLIDLAEDFDLNLIIMGATEAWRVADRLASNEIPVIIDPLSNIPVSFEHLGARLDHAALLNQSRVRFAITAPDQHNVRLLRQHAGNAVAHGLPWQQGLYAITRATADIFQLDTSAGTLAEGQTADLVIWSGDPLEVTTWATKVFIAGKALDPTTRQTQLYERYKTLKRAPHEYGYQR